MMTETLHIQLGYKYLRIMWDLSKSLFHGRI